MKIGRHLERLRISYFLVFPFGILLSNGTKLYGEPCASSCKPFRLQCVNGTCSCSFNFFPAYTTSLELKCSWKLDWQKDCKFTSCPSNLLCNDDFKCQCNGFNIMIDNKCYNARYVKPMEKCTLDHETAYLCDKELFSHCKNSKCICYNDYYFNSTLSECKPKSTSTFYKREHAYQASPNEYCVENSDCLTGLRCTSDFKCACPSGCKYLKTREVCDCGKVTLATPRAVIWVGCILGLLSVLFWLWRIKKTYKNRKPIGQDSAVPLENTPGTYHQNESTDANNISAVLLNSQFVHDNATSTLPSVLDNPPSYSEVVHDLPKGPFYPLSPPSVDSSLEKTTEAFNHHQPLHNYEFSNKTENLPPYPVSPLATNLNITQDSSNLPYPSYDAPVVSYNPLMDVVPVAQYPTNDNEGSSTTSYPTNIGFSAPPYPSTAGSSGPPYPTNEGSSAPPYPSNAGSSAPPYPTNEDSTAPYSPNAVSSPLPYPTTAGSLTPPY